MVTANGSMEFLIAPKEKHFYLGYPYPEKAIQVSVAQVLNSGGGVELVLSPERRFAGRFLQSMSLGPISGELDGGMDITLGDVVDNDSASIFLHASGSVDFCVFSVSAEAGLKATLYTAPSFHLHYDGTVSGSIDTWFGDLSASVGIDGDIPSQ